MKTPIPLLLLALAACDVDDPLASTRQTEQADRFLVGETTRVDVLWVVDNSSSMAAEQQKVVREAGRFLAALADAGVDYQMGAITTDPAEEGVLRAYDGSVVEGCEACRVLTTEVPCDSAASCPAQDVLARLVSPGTAGSALERGFDQAARALGVDGDAAPRQNAGLLRRDADLMIIFVSDEDEGLKRAATPVRYYERLFQSLKAGTASRVSVSAISGLTSGPVPRGEICAVFRDDDDDRYEALIDWLDTPQFCADVDDPNGSDAYAELSPRYVELACRTGGVVANLCAATYAEALTALAEEAASLGATFALSRASEVDRGEDCEANTGDEEVLECGEVLCVTVTPPGGEPEAASGFVIDEGAVVFEPGSRPAAGSVVEVRYALQAGVCEGGV